MASFLLTSGHLETSTRPYLPGLHGVFTKLTRRKLDVPIVCSWSVSFINCCSTLHGGSTVRTPKVKMSFKVDFLGLTISVPLIVAHLFQQVAILSRVMVQVGWACLA